MEEALRIHPTWINGGGDIPGHVRTVVAPLQADRLTVNAQVDGELRVRVCDNTGKVIWVSDGYVAQALLPQMPVSFAVDLPPDIAKNVQTYRVIVNHYEQTT